MFNSREIVTAVEIGTSKICVLIGEVDAEGRVAIIGRGTAPTSGSVVKGEICNMEKVFEQLAVALEEAARSSRGELDNSRLIVLTVTGCGIDSLQSTGTVFVKNEQRKVTERERFEAHENAKIQNLAPEREIINSSESYFLVDGRPVRNPLDQSARKLDACVHLIHGVSARVENFKTLIRNSGFEDSMVEVVFSPLADIMGVLSDDEREHGVLLVNLGAGTTEYGVEYRSGVQASGVIQVGFDHLANDLSVGLDLPLGQCRKLLEDGILNRMFREQSAEPLEFPAPGGGRRRIPLISFETIIDLRLRELFTLIKKRLEQGGHLKNLDAGGVLTGGGALFDRSSLIFREIFDHFPCRIGQPLEGGAAVPGVENPRYSTVWGALKIAGYYNWNNQGTRGRGAIGSLIDAMDGFLNRTRRGWETFKSSIRM